jgi:hypothetical protein
MTSFQKKQYALTSYVFKKFIKKIYIHKYNGSKKIEEIMILTNFDIN